MSSINIRIDDDVKKKAEKIFKKIGINHSIAINMFYHQVARTRSIPFPLMADEEPNEDRIEAMKEVEEMDKNINGDYKTYDNVDNLIEDLMKWVIKSECPQDLKRISKHALKEVWV